MSKPETGDPFSRLPKADQELLLTKMHENVDVLQLIFNASNSGDPVATATVIAYMNKYNIGSIIFNSQDMPPVEYPADPASDR